MSETNQAQMIRPAAIAARLGISTATLRNWIRSGQFPQGKRIGPRLVCWAPEVVERWFASRPVQGLKVSDAVSAEVQA